MVRAGFDMSMCVLLTAPGRAPSPISGGLKGRLCHTLRPLRVGLQESVDIWLILAVAYTKWLRRPAWLKGSTTAP